MFEAVAEMVLGDHLGGRTFDPPLGEPGYERVLAPGRGPFRTKDGYVCVLIYNDKQWANFLRIIDPKGEFSGSDDLATYEARAKTPDAVNAFVAHQMLERTTAIWLRLLSDADIPVAEVSTLNDVIDDPHLRVVGLLSKADHPTEGSLLSLGQPVHWSAQARTDVRHAPTLGEHSVEVLREIGYVDPEIKQLIASGVTVSRNV